METLHHLINSNQQISNQIVHITEMIGTHQSFTIAILVQDLMIITEKIGIIIKITKIRDNLIAIILTITEITTQKIKITIEMIG